MIFHAALYALKTFIERDNIYAQNNAWDKDQLFYALGF